MKSLIILFLLIGLVSAYNIEYRVTDFNTHQPIENVNVTLYNDSVSYSDLTDIHGLIDFIRNETNYFNVLAYRSGYTTYNGFLNFSNASLLYQDDIILNQFSQSGIIRLTQNDLTLSVHKSCFYFDNGRLEGCYNYNDTIILHANMNYTWVPIITITDSLSSITGINHLLYWVAPYLIGLFVLVILIVFVLTGGIIIGKGIFGGKK